MEKRVAAGFQGVNVDETISADAQLLSSQLSRLRDRLFPPAAQKVMRRFGSGEVAALVGISDSYLRQLSLANEGPAPGKSPGGRRLYTLEQIHQLRHLMAAKGRYALPNRSSDQHLQVLAVANFKGGSGKTTTAVHLAQFLALRGYRVLALDLDPQASLSALFGYQPEIDLKENETAYAAIRYDGQRRPLHEVIRTTYVAGLDLVPANLELHEFEHDTPHAMRHSPRGPGQAFFTRLADALAESGAGYDVVIIDCPPQLGFLTLRTRIGITELVFCLRLPSAHR